MSNAVLIFSGGLDSTTILLDLLSGGNKPYCVLFDYSQKHKVELCYAEDILRKLDVPYEVVRLPELKRADDEGYIVEGRNLIFLTYAHCISMRLGVKKIYAGFSEEDNLGFPDCRQSFIKEVEKVLSLGYGGDVKIHVPLISLSKKDIFLRNLGRYDLGFVVDNTLTCYNGVETLHPWGRGCDGCLSCSTRKEGFNLMQEEILN